MNGFTSITEISDIPIKVDNWNFEKVGPLFSTMRVETDELGVPVKLFFGDEEYSVDSHSEDIGSTGDWVLESSNDNGKQTYQMINDLGRLMCTSFATHIVHSFYRKSLSALYEEMVLSGVDDATEIIDTVIPNSEKYNVSSAFFGYLYNLIGSKKFVSFYNYVAQNREEKLEENPSVRYNKNMQLISNRLQDTSSIIDRNIIEADSMIEDISKVPDYEDYVEECNELALEEMARYFEPLRKENIPIRKNVLSIEIEGKKIYVETYQIGKYWGNKKEWGGGIQGLATIVALIGSGLSSIPKEIIKIYEFSNNSIQYGGIIVSDQRYIHECGGYASEKGIVFWPSYRRTNGNQLVLDRSWYNRLVRHEVAHKMDPYLYKVSSGMREGFARMVEFGTDLDLLKDNLRAEYKRPVNIDSLVNSLGIDKELLVSAVNQVVGNSSFEDVLQEFESWINEGIDVGQK